MKAAGTARLRKPKLTPRRARAHPDETRSRLVVAAAREIEHHGYYGTDSNRIARAAGYAPGTFYKHFVDKRAALLAAYDAWVTAEWDRLRLIAGESTAARARAIVDFIVDHHRRWRRLRAAVHALLATDAGVRRFHRAQRRRQLARMGVGPGAPAARRAAGALLLLEVERVADAIATGELAALGVSPAGARSHLIGRVLGHLSAGSHEVAVVG